MTCGWALPTRRSIGTSLESDGAIAVRTFLSPCGERSSKEQGTYYTTHARLEIYCRSPSLLQPSPAAAGLRPASSVRHSSFSSPWPPGRLSSAVEQRTCNAWVESSILSGGSIIFTLAPDFAPLVRSFVRQAAVEQYTYL